MSDLKLIYNDDLMECDLGFESGDLTKEDGLETAVFLSLFIDRRAGDDDAVDNKNDKRGWWGDQVAEIPGDQIGSKLWLLQRAKTTTETLRAAEEYAQEALQWFIDDGIAEGVTVEALRVKRGTTEVLGLKIAIKKSDGSTEAFEFDDLWASQID
jgi:phage gp46-like protein